MDRMELVDMDNMAVDEQEHYLIVLQQTLPRVGLRRENVQNSGMGHDNDTPSITSFTY